MILRFKKKGRPRRESPSRGTWRRIWDGREARRRPVARPAAALAAILGLILTVRAWGAEAVSDNYDAHYRKACTSEGCHPVREETSIPKHVPYMEARCGTCHEDHQSRRSMLLRQGGDGLCAACHEKVQWTTGTTHLAHPPDAGPCLLCHAPHESRIRGLMRRESELLICAQCHEDLLEKEAQKPHSHPFVQFKNQCGNCHYAHQNAANRYLRPEVGETCLTCHNIPIRIEGRTLENVAHDLATRPNVHGAIEKGSCPACHTPHGSDQESLLKGGYPGGSYAAYDAARYELCWQCHSPALVESEGGTAATGFRDGGTNLHRVHIVQLQRGRACHLCHEAHAATLPHLLRGTVRFGSWEAPLGWEPTAGGGRCLSPCHREKTYDRPK
jgi:predicted CXXCH cytochrome family protein